MKKSAKQDNLHMIICVKWGTWGHSLMVCNQSSSNNTSCWHPSAAEVLRLYPPVLVSLTLLWNCIYVDLYLAVRLTNKAVVLPAANSSSKPIYIPANTQSVLFCRPYVFFYWLRSFRFIYSVLVMHRRTDLWGPDGMKLLLWTPFALNAQLID